MTQNPYAHVEESGLDGGYDQLPMTPERTSILAIASLAFSILAIPACCIVVGVVPGLIGAFLGILALVMISKSNGRLGGRGLAITGVIIGLLFSAFSTFVLLGFNYGGRMFGQYGEVAAAAEQGDIQGVRSMLSRSANGALTDERIGEWSQEINLVWGSVVQYPKGLLDLGTGWMELGPQMNAMNTVQMSVYPPPDTVAPLPIIFDNGTAMLIVVMDQNEVMASNWPTLKNVGLAEPDGTLIWLIDPAQGP